MPTIQPQSGVSNTGTGFNAPVKKKIGDRRITPITPMPPVASPSARQATAIGANPTGLMGVTAQSSPTKQPVNDGPSWYGASEPRTMDPQKRTTLGQAQPQQVQQQSPEPVPFNDGPSWRGDVPVTPLPEVTGPVPVKGQPLPPPVPPQQQAPAPEQNAVSAADFSNVQSPYSVGAAPETAQGMPERYEAQDGVVSEDMLVENRVRGLMDSENPLMQKAIVNANNLSAQRGLQSSSIATENAVNSMFNFATPIAQQDASTFADQSFQNQQNETQVGLQDNQARNAMTMQQDQQRFTSTEAAVQRDFTVELEDLRNENNLGMLDAESQRRLVELEKQNEYAVGQMETSAGIQSTRDELLQQFNADNISMDAVNRLEQIEAQARENMAIQNNQNNFSRQMEYSNGISSAINRGIESLGFAYSNPEISPSQYASIEAGINAMIDGQIRNYADIYGINTDGTGGSAPYEPYEGAPNGGGAYDGPIQRGGSNPVQEPTGPTTNPTGPTQGQGPRAGMGPAGGGNGGLMGGGNIPSVPVTPPRPFNPVEPPQDF